MTGSGKRETGSGTSAAQQGAALPVVLVIVVVLTVIGIAMVDNALTEITIAGNQGFGVAAVYLAEAGIGDAVNRLRGNADLGQTAACTPGTLTFPAGLLESGIYEVCVQRVGTQRLIVSTGRARASPTDTDDAAVKTATNTARVLPSSFAYAVFGFRRVRLWQEAGFGGNYTPIVVQRFPSHRPMAVRGGPNAITGGTRIELQGATQVYGGLSSSGFSTVGLADPCLPVGPWTCEVNTAGPAFPQFNIRFASPGPDATSYEGRARSDTVGCGRLEGCYFVRRGDFERWVGDCNTPKCTLTAAGRIIGPGVFFVNQTTTIDDNLDLAELIGTLVIGSGDLNIEAGFTHRPCSDASPASCSDPALIVNGRIVFNDGRLDRQCDDVIIDGLSYVETQDFAMQFAPNPSQPDCDPSQPGRQTRLISVRLGMIMAFRDVELDGAARVEFSPAALDTLPPGLLTWPVTSPVLMPVGWGSR